MTIFVGSVEELPYKNWLNKWGLLVLWKTQWEKVGMVKVNTDLSSWRRQLGKSVHHPHKKRGRWGEAGRWQTDKGISCRICGCRVCGCKKCFSQVHWRNLHWGLLEANVLTVWAPGVLQDTNSWSQMEYFVEFAVAFYSLQSDLRAWVPPCFKALYMKQSELQAEVIRAAQ